MNLRALTFKEYTYSLTTAIGMYLLSSCHKQERRIDEITKIEVATGGCFGCDIQTAISIDSSLNYNYYVDTTVFLYGKNHGTGKGYFKGVISKKQWNKLVHKLNILNDLQHDNKGRTHIFHSPYSELIVWSGNAKTRFLRQPFDSKDEVSDIMRWIDSTRNYVVFKPTTDTPKFTTTLQVDPRLTH